MLLINKHFLCIGLGLNCFECQSKDDTVCLDPFTSNRQDVVGEAECDSKATHCVKYKTIMHLLDSGFITGRARGKTSVLVINSLESKVYLVQNFNKLKGKYFVRTQVALA